MPSRHKIHGKKSNEVSMVQKLYFDHYPFVYKSVLQWIIKNGVLRLERVSYPDKRIDSVTKILPLMTTTNFTVFCICSLFYLSQEQDIILWKDVRYWLWFFLGASSLMEAFIYYGLGFGSQSQSVVPVLNEAIDLVNEMHKSK